MEVLQVFDGTIYFRYKKGCTRLAVACDKVYQLLAHGRWFSSGTLASSTTNTGHHDIAESGIKTPKIKSIYILSWADFYWLKFTRRKVELNCFRCYWNLKH